MGGFKKIHQIDGLSDNLSMDVTPYIYKCSLVVWNLGSPFKGL